MAGSLRTAADGLESDDGGLTPFWLYASEGGARIERHVPALPLSLDRARLDALKRSLAVYRMAFGQARQEDVVAFLQRFPPDQLKAASDDLRIDLSPPPGGRTPIPDHDIQTPQMAVTDDELTPVWADVPDEPPDTHFGAIEALLDEFKALAGSTLVQVALPSNAKLAMLSELLDAFVAAAPQLHQDLHNGEGDSSKRRVTRSAEDLRLLLDQFVALQSAEPSVAVDDPLRRMQQLLDQFVNIRGLDRSPIDPSPETSSHA